VPRVAFERWLEAAAASSGEPPAGYRAPSATRGRDHRADWSGATR
jgi:hypothetical protein